ncbi:MAG: HlyD family type I secretion periplasmic adaptor subunit, partial [Hyphomicrobiales bacterium]
ACLALAVTFVAWAYFAELEAVARGEGRVVPSTRMQVVQSLEGGIVKALEVREGDEVTKGQVLIRIDDTGFASDVGELKAKERALRVQTTRLRHEASERGDDELVFPAELAQEAADEVANELVLNSIRRNNLNTQLRVLDERLEQKRRELAELQETQKRHKESLAIAIQEFELKKPLAERGIVPKTDVLRLEREIADLKGQVATTEQSLPRGESAVRETEQLVQEQKYKFRVEAQTELNTKLSELAIVQQSLRGATDKVRRTDIRSPVDGRVNKLHVNTVSGVVRAGEPMIEITPIEDNLLVEVRIKPSDIAFIRPGQKAQVKISAYDYTIYGIIPGNVEIISPDSTVDESTKEIYYAVTIRTTESDLRKGNESLPIIPGMVATVDIITGGKSVLDYILKPILKARHEALRER